MRTSGNTILITGGTSGIGLAFAEKFLQLGNKVIICGRRKERLNEIARKNSDVVTKVCDVSNTVDREELANWVIEHYPGVNVLINNAGVQFPADLTHKADMNRLRQEVDINFIAPVHLSSFFAQHLAGMKEAAIINISSGLAFAPLAMVPVYCATKAAIHSITLSLRHQLKNTPVKVFEIIPPAVDTELGLERRPDKTQSHGGISVSEFIREAMAAIENDMFEAPIAGAERLREKGDALFAVMNNRT